jgi:hypothetical protein
MARTVSLLLAPLAASIAAAAPPCHAPWGNEQSLESPCFSSVLSQGDVSVRRYLPRGAAYEQAFVQASFPGGGDPTAYLARLDEAVVSQLQYFSGRNAAGAVIARTSPILGRPNSTGQLFFDWMLPTSAFPTPAQAPAPPAALHLQLAPSTLGARHLVAALHFTVTGVPGPGDFDEACDTLLPLLPAMGYAPVAGGDWSPTYAYYTSRDFDGQHDGECLLEVLKA